MLLLKKKTSRDGELTAEGKDFDQSICNARAAIESINQCLKKFAILGNAYRGPNDDIDKISTIGHIVSALCAMGIFTYYKVGAMLYNAYEDGCETDVSDNFPQNRFDIIYIPIDNDVRTNIKQHFNRTNELLHSYYMENERCLVHCVAGISRSTTVVLAYLMKYHHNTLTEAFHYLVEKRPQIWPNEGFMIQLLRYENKLIKSREIVLTSAASETSLCTAASSSNETKNSIETLEEFKKKEQI
ncbi:unnamed protein product [Rotaria sp. Silwood1]|nr:unnamed protein product [Rotaria sp. Silwood1]